MVRGVEGTRQGRNKSVNKSVNESVNKTVNKGVKQRGCGMLSCFNSSFIRAFSVRSREFPWWAVDLHDVIRQADLCTPRRLVAAATTNSPRHRCQPAAAVVR